MCKNYHTISISATSAIVYEKIDKGGWVTITIKWFFTHPSFLVILWQFGQDLQHGWFSGYKHDLAHVSLILVLRNASLTQFLGLYLQ